MPEWPKGAACKVAGDAYGGSNPPPPTCDVSRHRADMSRDIVPRSPRSVLGLVVATRVQDQLAEQLTVLGDHPNLQAIDEDEHPRADETSSESDVVQP